MTTDLTLRSVVLRRMTVSDVPGCVEVLQEHDPSQDAQEWVARLGRDVADLNKGPVVAVVENLVVGYARTLPFHYDTESPPDAAPEGYYLLGLVVALAHRKRGVGRLLTAERLRWLVERGTASVYYYTHRDNVASQLLHEQMGFRGLTRKFWFPTLLPDHAEVLFCLHLPSTTAKAADSQGATSCPPRST